MIAHIIPPSIIGYNDQDIWFLVFVRTRKTKHRNHNQKYGDPALHRPVVPLLFYNRCRYIFLTAARKSHMQLTSLLVKIPTCLFCLLLISQSVVKWVEGGRPFTHSFRSSIGVDKQFIGTLRHLVFTLGRLDVLPVGDLGIRNGVKLLYGLPAVPTPTKVRAVAEANGWAPYESVASWYIWWALDNTPVTYAAGDAR